MNEPRLCYVDGPWAYFTTQDLDKQWGDDWNDTLYNAGAPYEWSEIVDGPKGRPRWEIKRVAWSGQLETPDAGHVNSPYSVELINSGATPWLKTSSFFTNVPKVEIMAGVTMREFIDLVWRVGGVVYLPIRGEEGP